MYQENTSMLTNIPETMLVTLWAKAIESQNHTPILIDKKSTEIIQKINYDFTRFKGAKFSQVGICTRAKLIDDETVAFINKHQQSIIVQIGAGLDTRFHRLNCPKNVTWYDIDVPEVIALREKLITRQDNNYYLAYSMFDEKWMAYIQDKCLPTLIIIEGVLMYFEEKDVRQFFDMICQNFDKAEMVFDMLFYKGVGNAKKSDAVSKTKGQAEYLWSMLNSQEIEKWNNKLSFNKEYYMSDYYGNRCPFPFNLLYKLPYFYKNFNQRVVCLGIKPSTK